MADREPGYYWIAWSQLADPDLAARRPAPLISRWDGKVWWFVQSDVYRFDCEVEAISGMLAPPRRSPLQAVSGNPAVPACSI
jgi:hypothetical protein